MQLCTKDCSIECCTQNIYTNQIDQCSNEAVNFSLYYLEKLSTFTQAIITVGQLLGQQVLSKCQVIEAYWSVLCFALLCFASLCIQAQTLVSLWAYCSWQYLYIQLNLKVPNTVNMIHVHIVLYETIIRHHLLTYNTAHFTNDYQRGIDKQIVGTVCI